MASYAELFIIVMALVTAGTSVACVQSARAWRPPAHEGQQGGEDKASGAPGWLAIAMGALLAVALVTAGLRLEARLMTWTWGEFWRTVAGFGVTDAALVMLTARSWRARAVMAVATVAVSMAWVMAPSWLTFSLAAGFIAVALIVIGAIVQPGLSFRAASAIGLALAFGYDAVQVLVTRAMLPVVAADPFSGAAAGAPAAAGRGLHVIIGAPAMIGVPAHAAALSPYAASVGIGDLAIPGILVVVAGSTGRKAGTGRRLQRAAIAGYALGLAATFTVNEVTGATLPALAFLVPGIVVTVTAAAWLGGGRPALAAIWRDDYRGRDLAQDG